MEQQHQTRKRVNVSKSTKGVLSYDCTVEMMDATNESILAASDALVAELEARYPIVQEEKGK